MSVARYARNKVQLLHDNAATSGTPFRAFTVSATAFTRFFVIDEVLRLDGHVYDVWGGAE